MEFAVLGPLLVRRGGTTIDIGSRKQRALLIHLLLHAGRTVPVDRLIDALWDEDPPPQARITLRSYISNLRRVLHTPDEDNLIATRSNGYAVDVDTNAIDAVRFERGVGAARAHLKAGAPDLALGILDESLQLWRGQALADLGHSEAGSGDRIRLEELRLSAHEDRFDALLALGRHQEAVPSLEAFTAAEPLRERARAQLMLGLYRSGRAPDALQAFQRFRQTLVDELGLDPSPQLQQLADRILNQAPDLQAPTLPAEGPLAAQREPAPSVPDQATALIGRVHERAELQAGLTRLCGGEGGLVLFAGEPGIGKTALLEELARLARAADVQVYWGKCHESLGAPAFWPWVQILRALARAHDDAALQEFAGGDAGAVGVIVEEIARRTGGERPVVGDDMEGARFQLYDAIATFLFRVAETTPLVLLLDDLHWADAASLQTLAFLTPMLSAGRILVAGSYRDVRADFGPELEDTLATVIREPATRELGLTGLQPDDVGQLAQLLSGEPAVAEHGEMLYERTGGNPFFVRQVSQLLRDSGLNSGTEATIPSGVRHVLARRLSTVSPPVRAMLDAAAVLGRSFDVRRLAEITGLEIDTVLDGAAEAAAHGVLEGADRSANEFRFVHALVRETIYDGIAPHRRVRLHAQIAAVLERQPQANVEEIADHLWHAADVLDDDRAVRYLIEAADQALEVFGHEQAEEHLRRALVLLTDHGRNPPDELQVRARLVQLIINTRGWTSPAIEEFAGSIRGLIAKVGIRPEILALWSSMLGHHMARGDVDAVQRVAEEMVDEGTAAGDSFVLAAAHSAFAYLEISLGRDLAKGLEHVALANEHAAATPPEQLRAPPHVGVQIAVFEAMGLAMQGDEPGAKEAARRAIAAAEEIGDPYRLVQVLTNAGIVGMVLEDPAFAEQAAARAMSLCQENGLRMAMQGVIPLDSWARARLGEDPAEHADRMWEALRANIAAGHGGPRAKYLLYTAETYLLARDAVAASRCLDQARTHGSHLGEQLPSERLARVEEGIEKLAASG